MRLRFSLIAHKVALEELAKLDCETPFECCSITGTMVLAPRIATFVGTMFILIFEL